MTPERFKQLWEIHGQGHAVREALTAFIEAEAMREKAARWHHRDKLGWTDSDWLREAWMKWLGYDPNSR